MRMCEVDDYYSRVNSIPLNVKFKDMRWDGKEIKKFKRLDFGRERFADLQELLALAQKAEPAAVRDVIGYLRFHLKKDS